MQIDSFSIFYVGFLTCSIIVYENQINSVAENNFYICVSVFASFCSWDFSIEPKCILKNLIKHILKEFLKERTREGNC